VRRLAGTRERAAVDDDGTGWNEVLVGGWTPEVRDAVVERVTRLTVGWRGPLLRALGDPEGAPAAWTETLHQVVVRAIAEETGADLDELGSHAAWACYEEVWQGLVTRWADGGDLATVPLGAEPDVVRLIAGLPPMAAEAAGADVTGQVPDPLWLAGRLRVDVEGLRSLLDRRVLTGADEVRIETLLERVDGRRR
jgi:hypothetical protein